MNKKILHVFLRFDDWQFESALKPIQNNVSSNIRLDTTIY